MLLFFLPLLLGVSAKISNMEFYGEGGISFLACAYLNSHYLFCEEPSDYACYCTNDNAQASVMGCLATYGSSSDAENYFIKYCDKWYDSELSSDMLEESYQLYLDKAADPLVANPKFNMTADNMTTPLLVNTSAAELYRESYKVFLGNYDHSVYYGIGAISYWFFVFILAAIANWGVVLFPGLRDFFNGRVSKAWRKNVTVPALWSRKRSTQQDFLGGILSFLIPSRLESLLLVIFFWLVFALLVVEIRYIPNDPLFHTRKEAITRFVADRTGIIATITVPLLILFGGRNNILQWFTRWDFATFIVYHRWIARLMVAMAFVHSVCFSALYVMDGIYFEEMAETYVTWGIVATACGAIICFQGLLFLRRAYYETFLDYGTDIVFYCKVKNGVTKKIGRKLANVPGRAIYMKVAVEGPYGETSPVNRHSNVTYFAGGNGIPGIFAETLTLGKQAATRSTNNQKIKLVWIMREMKSLAWFAEELEMLCRLPVEATIYITRPEMREGIEDLECVFQKMTEDKVLANNSSNDSEHSAEKADEKELKGEVDTTCVETLERARNMLPHVTILEGRPDLSSLVKSDIEESSGSAAFVTCGHPAMVDDLRYCVLKAMDNTNKRVDFYDQLQVWA
ncbi:hypothetical protein CXQ85_003090 [Candidozyma haemuli]|uniref:FAD-binding FR-type domain-containing protein n=1 Tax=Candidozyma haemuli TaxID=45357 RepID=A0A2V1B0Q3_9ASCO|nr:hypothetical protein CXQ85_003090 [[Candida] haemuloni]PVH23356.1 hypothetical protein CXQ85_003090 [[Candida] haemuloni]